MIDGALAMEGGSLRCLFTSGVVDVLMENNIYMSYVIGVSAGSLTGVNYVSKQIGRTADINISFVNDKRYLGVESLITKHMIFNFDFLFGEISDKLLPFDYDEFMNSPQRFACVATNVATGKPEYFERGKCSDIYAALRASSSMPLLSKMVKIDDKDYLDGGLSLAVPYQKPIDEGFDKVVVIVSRQHGFRKMPVSRSMGRAYLTRYRKYPNLVKALMNTPRMYAKEMREIDELEAQGRIFVIRPEEPITISRIEKDTEKLKALYIKGRDVAKKQLPALKKYLGIEKE
jgi:predicted patatin/cPLA2 family phospholipase